MRARAACVCQNQRFLFVYGWLALAFLNEVFSALPLASNDDASKRLRLWATDRLNILECVSLGLAFLGMSYYWTNLVEIQPDTLDVSQATPMAIAQSMISTSLIFMWIGVGMRLCALLPMMGPLVRMMEFLLVDVLRW